MLAIIYMGMTLFVGANNWGVQMNDILESAIHDAMISLYTGFRFRKWGGLFIINHFQNL